MGRLLIILAIIFGIFWLIRTILLQSGQKPLEKIEKRDESPKDKDRK